jgi:glutaminyl-tRNA synthetase
VTDANPQPLSDFVRDTVRADVAAAKNGGRVVTRFPPEPNGYLHVGHAKAICLDFGVAQEFAGHCNLRMDDTNPLAEDAHYEEQIQKDVRWLGFDWGDHFYRASDYFERLYGWAEDLVVHGKAYVCDLSEDEIRAGRGTVTEAGTPSPYRSRTPDENLALLRKMRAGDLEDGSCVLRARIDMASPNMKMRDPLIYRIRHATHHRTGDAWPIYPLYDFAHGLSDAIEGVTHSLCTLEFENNRELYDWFLDNLEVPSRPVQIEFARLNLTYTALSKRRLLELVTNGHVHGWDDPRMPTLAAMRRRGYAPEAIRRFCEHVGVAKNASVVDVAVLEHFQREHLNAVAPRVMAVLDPLEVVIENWPAGEVVDVEAVNNPEDESAGTRTMPFAGRLFIEAEDFREEPPPKYFRLSPGREVRLKHGFFITCRDVVKDASGKVTQLRCTYDPATRSGNAPDGRNPKGTLHWVSAEHAVPAEVRLYDRLFTTESPGTGDDWLKELNPQSLEARAGCFVEPSLAGAAPGTSVQFLRHGYFCVDPDSRADRLVLNRTVSLRDSWAKLDKRPS